MRLFTKAFWIETVLWRRWGLAALAVAAFSAGAVLL